MSRLVLEFDSMNENERYRLVHEIYGESNLENVRWDNPEVEDFSKLLFEYEKGYMDFVQSFLVNEKNRYYIFEINGQWVSALRMTKVEDFYYLEALETAKQYRKKGYGTEFLQELIRMLKKRGKIIIRSNVSKKNMASLAVHKKCGFVIEEENGINCLTGEQRKSVYGMIYENGIK